MKRIVNMSWLFLTCFKAQYILFHYYRTGETCLYKLLHDYSTISKTKQQNST